MQISTQTRRPANRAGGFTLVEILVVMAIMAILISLGIGLLGTSGQQARIAATQTTLKHLDALIKQRTEAFRTANLTKVVDNFITYYKTANSMASISPQDRKAIEILVRKNLFKQLFPMEDTDLYGMNGTVGDWDDAPRAADVNGWNGPELFYWSMTQGTAYGLSPVNIDGIPSAAIVPSPANADRMIFVDAWGNPIEFYRWPTQLMADTVSARILIPGLPAELNKDPDDPLKVISNASMGNKFRSTFSLSDGTTTLMMNPFNAANYHDLNVYHTPLLVSGGPDGKTGLDKSNKLAPVLDQGAVADDISNRQGK